MSRSRPPPMIVVAGWLCEAGPDRSRKPRCRKNRSERSSGPRPSSRRHSCRSCRQTPFGELLRLDGGISAHPFWMCRTRNYDSCCQPQTDQQGRPTICVAHHRRGRTRIFDYAVALKAKISKQQVEDSAQGTGRAWADESHRIAIESVYVGIPGRDAAFLKSTVGTIRRSLATLRRGLRTSCVDSAV
jgi:hypothetical protein